MTFINCTREELQKKLLEIIEIDPTLVKDVVKIYIRVKKYGDPNFVKPKRERVSPSHKQEIYKRWYDQYTVKKRLEREQKKEKQTLHNIPRPKRGRPPKNKLDDCTPSDS